MGVAGLWDVLRPAGQTRSLSHLALQDGFNRPPSPSTSSSAAPLRGFRIGIDASIWFFHAAYGREGENPELRTLFFRCARLMHTPFLPLFVFDGPKRPNLKRGKRIGKEAHWLTGGMKNIIEAFGFEWRTAPGEAEAELAYLNRIGVIDGILSDDVDNFLFGATLVIRNPSATLIGNSSHSLPTTNHTTLYSFARVTTHPEISLTRGGLILVALLSGGDYHKGLEGCGSKVAVGLARCGFGDRLVEACARLIKEENGGRDGEDEEGREDFEEWLVGWREDVARELETNSMGHLPNKRASLARTLRAFNDASKSQPKPKASSSKTKAKSSSGSKSSIETFPAVRILLYYTTPLTSETYHKSARNKLQITWDREPDLGKIANVCELYFEWGWKEMIVKRFRTVIWNGAVCRIMRRAVVEADRKVLANKNINAFPTATAPSTPHKNRGDGENGRTECGTPSKMIAKHFSSLSVSSPPQHPSSPAFSSASHADEDNVEEEPLITKIHSSRTHLTTDNLLEYRLEIAPAQLVRLVEGGILGTRVAPEVDDVYEDDEVGDEDDESAADDSDDERAGGKKKGKGKNGLGRKPPPDPDSHLRLWMPACMVRLVEPGLVEEFEEGVRRRKEKKAMKGKGGGRRKKVVGGAEESGDEGMGTKKKAKATTKSKTAAKKVPDNLFEESEEERMLAKSKKPAAGKKAKAKATTAYVDISDDSMDSDNVRRNLKGYFAVSKPQMISPPKAKPKAASTSNLIPRQQERERSKPPPIPHIPLYDDSSEPEVVVTVSAPMPLKAKSQPKSKSSPFIIPISDMLSPKRKPSSSAPAPRSPSRLIEPRPFPMTLDYVNDFDFNFDIGDPNWDQDVGMNINDDPFVDVPVEIRSSPAPSPPKQARKKAAQLSPSGSDSDSRIKKSPRKAHKQRSPKHPVVVSDLEQSEIEVHAAARPGSPSPMHPKSRPAVSRLLHNAHPNPVVRKPPQHSKISKTALVVSNDGIIDISSGEDAPPSPLSKSKPMKAPLLIAREKKVQLNSMVTKAAKPAANPKTKYGPSIADMNVQDDIIDLT